MMGEVGGWVFGFVGVWVIVVEAAVVGSPFWEFLDHGFEVLLFALEVLLLLFDDDFGFVLVFLDHEVELLFQHAHFLLDRLLDVSPLGIESLVQLENLVVELLVLLVDVLQLQLFLLYHKLFLLQQALLLLKAGW